MSTVAFATVIQVSQKRSLPVYIQCTSVVYRLTHGERADHYLVWPASHSYVVTRDTGYITLRNRSPSRAITLSSQMREAKHTTARYFATPHHTPPPPTPPHHTTHHTKMGFEAVPPSSCGSWNQDLRVLVGGGQVRTAAGGNRRASATAGSGASAFSWPTIRSLPLRPHSPAPRPCSFPRRQRRQVLR